MGLLADYFPDCQPQILPGENFGNFIALPSDSDAQYSFHIWSAFGERQIAAVLKNAESGVYFYHYPFELADFKNESQLDLGFNEKLELILAHDTQVRQQNGAMWATFGCEYLDNGEWKRLGGTAAALRWANFRIPKAPLYRAVYYRGPKGFSKSNKGIGTRGDSP
jgi:hypothetical protein